MACAFSKRTAFNPLRRKPRLPWIGTSAVQKHCAIVAHVPNHVQLAAAVWVSAPHQCTPQDCNVPQSIAGSSGPGLTVGCSAPCGPSLAASGRATCPQWRRTIHPSPAWGTMIAPSTAESFLISHVLCTYCAAVQ